jgi:hypothetical protein
VGFILLFLGSAQKQKGYAFCLLLLAVGYGFGTGGAIAKPTYCSWLWAYFVV